ncbi:hypothetical protein QBC46DRAFT_420398 [Diplogelasinospora grovesii]|uniref:PKS/mFAS DH domain-containing protein n=1 Tax=Diplogelasinospora grovesii TaxID=303347 RepID=A0AAN6S0L2_9PEZI|nr:hypothetical protein QBC46DRAFT_420398 [Diplogelasinospora grovesii]
MLLHEDRGIEMVTTLRRRSLTASNDSKFWEFSISSENNGTWTKHCWGLVASGRAVALPPNPDVAPHARIVDSKRWYTTLSRIGLNYSNRFVGLENITASPVAQVASVSITDRQVAGEEYALHPSTLDQVLQSWSVALAKGEHHQLDKLFLPTFIEQFYVGADGGLSTLRVRTTSKGKIGAAVGSSYGLVGDEGEVAFVLNGFQTSRMEGSSFTQSAPELKYMSIQWHPAFDFVAPGTLMRPSGDVTADIIFREQYGLLAAAEVHHVAATVKSLAQPYFKHFLAGVAKHMDQVDQGLSKIPDAAELKALGREARRAKLVEWREQSKGGPVENIIEALWRVAINAEDMLEGRRVLIDVLLEGDMLQKFYDEANSWSDVKDFFRVLGLNKPQIRAMHSTHGERLYEDYTITDVSAGFVNQTKERFAQYGNLKFAVCDITVDPLEQGFEPASYDLIIASNVLHATPNLVETLTRCRSLLKPDGHIFMQEFCSNTRYADLIMGCFEGWWAGVEEGRVECPVIQEDGWDAKLRQSGFQGIRSAVRDNKHPHFFHTSNILARVQSGETCSPDDSGKTRLTLLKPSAELSEFGQGIKSTLEAEGYTLDEYVWGAKLPDDQDIVSLMDVDPERAPLLADIDAQDLTSFVDTLGDVVPGQAVLWLMRPAQIQSSDPQYGQMPGVARCVRAELAIDLITLEQDSLDIESEFVWHNGQVLVSRVHTSSIEQALADAAPPAEARHLTIGQPGMLQTMRWVGHPLPPLAADDVQIRIKATGMNFHDVAVAMGIVGPDGDMEKDGYHGLGSEGTAIVTAVGANVTHVAVGDRVVFMEISTSCFATEKQLPSGLVARAPEELSDEDAAGLWIPYTAALWSYLEKAHMKRGQTVLIHSAAGGVGIAAIHVARWLGADFYCTVGPQAKADFPTTVHGVPRERISNSRDDSFAADVMRATGGVGVDVVLNSLSGELLHASWKCVAIGGCMVDLGKRDFLGRGRLEMLPFVGNRAFFGVDLAYMIVNQKHKLMPYLQQAIDLFRDGQLFPLHPTTVFEADRVQDAFRCMQKGVHMGRIVVRMPEDSASLPLTLPTPKPTFSADAVYLVAGGLGGLGGSILGWMASLGARHLLVMSPSAGTRDEHRQFVDELAELGCELRCFAGDVADVDFLRDTGFLNMDHDVWSTVTSPKVKGTWNLHQLLPNDLDFFIMCGSTSGTLGSYGQANYAAANTYLDAFLHFRHGLGLPATALDIAAIGDIGYVACNKSVAERLGRAVARFMTEGEFLTCLQLAVERSDTNVPGGFAANPILQRHRAPVLGPTQHDVLASRSAPVLFRNNQGLAAQGTGTGSEGLRSFLASLSTEPERLDEPKTVTFLAGEIAKRIFSFLMKEDAAINVSQTLSAISADSLVAIEIRN